MTTKLVNKNVSPFDVLITRSTIWGNPNIAAPKGRRCAIEEYKKWFLEQPDLISQLYKLYDKTLGCVCSPLPCHGDFLVKICNSFKCIIAGDRRFTNSGLFSQVCTKMLKNKIQETDNNITIISGCQTGTDSLAIEFANDNKFTCLKIPADWCRRGASAGPERNIKMAKIADACLIFDGGGPGSKSMYRIAKEQGIKVIKVSINEDL